MSKRYFVIESTYTLNARKAKGKDKAYRGVEIEAGPKGERAALAFARELAARFQQKPEVAGVRVFEATADEYKALQG